MDLNQLEGLIEKPYWVVDILPEQVPAGSPGSISRWTTIS